MESHLSIVVMMERDNTMSISKTIFLSYKKSLRRGKDYSINVAIYRNTNTSHDFVRNMSFSSDTPSLVIFCLVRETVSPSPNALPNEFSIFMSFSSSQYMSVEMAPPPMARIFREYPSRTWGTRAESVLQKLAERELRLSHERLMVFHEYDVPLYETSS